MTAVDRPDNGQDEGRRWRVIGRYQDTGETVVMDGLRVVGSFYRPEEAARAVAAVNASRRAGAGEQQREQHEVIAHWLACRYTELNVTPEQDADADADELLALLGGPPPDGEAEYATARHAFGSPEYLTELAKLSAPPCPSRSHGADGWHCAVQGPHGDGDHTNAAGTVTW